MKDLVVGAIYKYGWKEVKNWALSLSASGFKGRKLLLAYSMEAGLAEKLQELDIEIIPVDFLSTGRSISAPMNVIDLRHFHMWCLLKDLDLSDYRFIVSTDVKDLIFQSDPTDWLERNTDEQFNFLAPSEGIELQYEPWNAKSMYHGFGPIIYEKFKNVSIVNCGTIAGRAPYFRDLELVLFSLTERSLLLNVDCMDQTSLTILAHTCAKNDMVVIDHDAGWACQCGVMLDPHMIDMFRPHLNSPEPKVKDGLVYTSTGLLFSLVHQYDRVPSLNEAINNRYR